MKNIKKKISFSLSVFCFLSACSSYSEVAPDEHCVEWTEQEIIKQECTRHPYRTCIERTTFRLVCLRREKIT